MGISCKQRLDSGVPVGYHRVVSTVSHTNVQDIVEVASYVDAQARAEELRAAREGVGSGVFIHTRYYSFPWGSVSGIEDAYSKIKETEEFAGATDVLEDEWEPEPEEEPEAEGEPEPQADEPAGAEAE